MKFSDIPDVHQKLVWYIDLWAQPVGVPDPSLALGAIPDAKASDDIV